MAALPYDLFRPRRAAVIYPARTLEAPDRDLTQRKKKKMPETNPTPAGTESTEGAPVKLAAVPSPAKNSKRETPAEIEARVTAEITAKYEAKMAALTAELTKPSPAVKRAAKAALATAMIEAMGSALKALPADHPANAVGTTEERDQIVAQWVHHFPADRKTWKNFLPVPQRAGWNTEAETA